MTSRIEENIKKLLNMLPNELSQTISERNDEYTSIWCNRLITDYEALFQIIIEVLEQSKIIWKLSIKGE
jgi:hypothetical protein